MSERLPRAAARRTATDEKIAAAVWEIVRADGVQAVTIDAVSARSGVAKTTIYRRYDDRFELLSGVLERVAPRAEDDAGEVTQHGIAVMVRDVQDVFEERVGLTGVAQVLASEDPFMRQWREKVVVPRLSALQGYLARGAAEGTLDSKIDYDLVVEMVVGGMVIRHARHGDVPEDWAQRTVETLWPVLRGEAQMPAP